MNVRFKPPKPPSITVKRTGLLEEFRSCSESRLIYISAPAGSGKTVSTIQWLEASKVDVAWLSLNKYDDMPTSFFHLLMSAFLSVQRSSVLKSTLESTDFLASPAELTLKAFGQLRDGSGKRVIVLDDFHVIENEEITKTLPLLLKRIPSRFMVIFISRMEPPAMFSDFVLNGSLHIVGAERLFFSRNEINTLYEKRGFKLAPKEAERLFYYTKGWPICVSAALLAGNTGITERFDYSILKAYIRNEIWDSWSNDKKDFLMKVSIAETLTPELCTHLTGRTDCAELLRSLISAGAFLTQSGKSDFIFHHLFRDFLTEMLNSENGIDTVTLYKRAGEWYYNVKDYYKSADFCLKAGDYDGFTKAAVQINKYVSYSGSVETELSFISASILEGVSTEIIEQSPLLLDMCAFAAFLNGDSKTFTSYLDKMCERLPEIIQTIPEFGETVMFMRGIDSRVPLKELARELSMVVLPPPDDKNANSNTLSMNLPYFHRSQRDYAEYAGDFGALEILASSYGRLIGRQYSVIEDCIRSGLLYEQGNLSEAYEYAVSANSKLKNSYSSEIKFCAMMLLADVQYSMDMRSEAEITEKAACAMIEAEALHLTSNYMAFVARRKIQSGDVSAAKKWLSSYSADISGRLKFYKIYQHFTTARAYLLTGEYGNAVLFLSKLEALSEEYNRPLDIIEANVLYSIAWWKRGKKAKAVSVMEKAVGLAAKYGFTRVFDEDAAVVPILHKCHTQALYGKERNEEEAWFVKTLYIAAYEKFGTKAEVAGLNIKLSKRQTDIMKLLAAGLSYKQISEEAGIAVSSVKTHIQAVYSKLGVASSYDALSKIKELGIWG